MFEDVLKGFFYSTLWRTLDAVNMTANTASKNWAKRLSQEWRLQSKVLRNQKTPTFEFLLLCRTRLKHVYINIDNNCTGQKIFHSLLSQLCFHTRRLVDVFWQGGWVSQPRKNIHPWKRFTPEKYSPLKNIHPTNIHPTNIHPLKIFTL